MRLTQIAFALGLAASAASAEGPPPDWLTVWPETDFSRASASFDEIVPGGPGRDGVPALSAPPIKPAAEETGVAAREPVIVLEMAGETPRAYPLRYMTWHQIVNDEIGGVPVAVTFCPLCNASVVFDRRRGGEILDLGVSGLIRNSDMIMYDRLTGSWWQQYTGEAIVGALTGETLTVIPSWVESWGAFVERNPEGLVMAEPAGHERPYGLNPYEGYDGSHWPFLYKGERPPYGIEPLSRVVAVGARAWPLDRLAAEGEIEEEGVRLTWKAGQASALDTREIGAGRDIGDVRVYQAETGAPLAHDIPFAFAFHAFRPDGEWMTGD